MHRCALLSALTLAASLAAQTPQVQAPTFKAGVEASVLDVSVFDKDGKPVHGLTAADFVVLEDGKPQSISAFSAVDVPAAGATPQARSWLRTVPADVVTNTVHVDGRLIVLVLDDLAPMAPGEGPRAADLARKAIARLGPLDVASVVFPSGRQAGENFTADRGRLEAAIGRYVPRMTRDFDMFDPSFGPTYTAVTTAIRSLVERLAGLGQRRKAIFWVGAGFPVALEAPPGDDAVIDQLHDDWVDVFAAASRANVDIYCLDPGGNRGEAVDLHEGPTLFQGNTNAPSQRTPHGQPSTGGMPATRPHGRINVRFLQAVAANTGGIAVTEANDPGPGLDRVFAESGSYYLLGYQSSNPPNRKAYNVQVRVNRPGAAVRTRKTYSPQPPGHPSTTTPSLLTDALQALLPSPDVGLQVVAAPFPATATARPVIAVIVGIDEATPARETVTPDEVDVVVSAYRAGGQPAGSKTTHVKVALPVGSDHVQYEVLTSLDLAPGRYDLRAAAASTFAQKAGSVATMVDVPDFAKTRLSLSGVVLSMTPNDTAIPRDALRSFLSVIPTTRRDFAPGESVTALVRVHQGGDGATTPVALAVKIVDAEDRTEFQAAEQITADRFADRSAEYRLDLPLGRLRSGPHLLTIEATLGKEAVRRTSRFQVR